jgi:hypothetical protein
MLGITMSFDVNLWTTHDVMAMSAPPWRICTRGGPAEK